MNRKFLCYLIMNSNLILNFKKLPKINIYTNELIKDKNLSIEHIIPKRIFKNKNHANNIYNLAFTDKKTNSKRRDFKYGDIINIPSKYNKKNLNNFYDLISDDFESVLDSEQKVNGIISSSRRLFYPISEENYGCISRSIIKLLYEYPYLYSSLNEIIYEPHILSKWNKMPETKFEIERNKLIL